MLICLFFNIISFITLHYFKWERFTYLSIFFFCSGFIQNFIFGKSVPFFNSFLFSFGKKTETLEDLLKRTETEDVLENPDLLEKIFTEFRKEIKILRDDLKAIAETIIIPEEDKISE